MNENIETYFAQNPNTPRKTREENKQIRKEKAREQVGLVPVARSQVFSYVNEFLEMIRKENGYSEINIKAETLSLDNSNQAIINNGIIAKECNWVVPVWDDENKKYSQWEHKYTYIKNKFNLDHTKNIVWLKFTTSGHLGVVAKGMDINFSYDSQSGECVKAANESWDNSFVFIFPLTNDILESRNTGDIERGIGNYLIAKGVPIIDFYSHNY